MTTRPRRPALARAALGVLAVVALWTWAPGTAAASSVSSAELADLATSAAAGDEGALAQLREVDRVDGQPVDVERLLASAGDDQLSRRLEVLADQAGHGDRPPGAAAARRQAEDVLSGKDFKPRQPPRPLRGVLNWLGQRMEPVTDRASAFFAWLAAEQYRLLPVALVVAVVVVALAFRLGRHRSPLAWVGDRHSLGGAAGDDPAELEAAAERAEAAGDLSAAVRLRFRAGLLRLDRAGRLQFRPSLTTGLVRSLVASPEMDRLSADFDEIAYGGRPASPADVAGARDGWARLLAGAGR